MQIIAIVLTSALISALIFGAFVIGLQIGKNNAPVDNSTIKVNDKNKDAVKNIAELLSYRGRGVNRNGNQD